jgi:hypothetical protein
MVADEITLQKVSISRIKQEMRDVYYLSDDLVIASSTSTAIRWATTPP